MRRARLARGLPVSESIYASDPNWYTVERGIRAKAGRHVVGADLCRPRKHGKRADHLICAVSGYTGIKPTLLVHGERNPIHPADQVRELLAAYPQRRCPETVWLKAKHNDFMSFNHKVFGQMINRIDSWMERTLLPSS